MTTIYLIRHAEAEGNLYRRIHGWYNALITENGFAQIDALERRFRDIPIDAVYSSDLYRTMTTARSIYKAKGLPLHTDPDLREIHMGDWEDWTWGSKSREEPESMAAFQRCDPAWRAPNGESFREVGDRVQGAVRRIAANHPNQTVAIFTHGCAIRQLLADLKGFQPGHWNEVPHGENTCVTRLFFENDQLTLDPSCEMDPSHLDDSIRTLAKQNWWRKDNACPQDVNLWFRAAEWPKDREIYLQAREEAWHNTHANGPAFDGESFLKAAEEHLEATPRGVVFAMSGDQLVGIVEVDPVRYAQDNAGYIPFCYIVPDLREQSLGSQLLGEAISFFRPLGRDKLRLRCAPYNARAQRFYAKSGFHKIGEEQNSRVPLDILEKYIGYDR